MATYRKTELFEAMQYNPDGDLRAFVAFLDGIIDGKLAPEGFVYRTFDSHAYCPAGSWMVKKENGDFYSVAPSYFARDYEPVTP